MQTLDSTWATGLGLRAPVVCAPMGGVAGGRLAGAVSVAGGLGMIGMGSASSVAALERELAELDAVTARGIYPFGIGLVAWKLAAEPALLDAALEARPALVSVSFGDWGQAAQPWISKVQKADALAVAQVATVEEALAAEATGVDAVVARGLEAGGHGDHQEALQQLLEGAVAAVSIPVLAAGAISSHEDVARALAAGAAAAWVGTAFAACEEALTTPAARAELIAAQGTDTVVSRVMDVALERPWPARYPERMLNTEFVQTWHGRENELAQDAAARARFAAAAATDDFTILPLDAGLGVGNLASVRPAAEVLRELVRG